MATAVQEQDVRTEDATRHSGTLQLVSFHLGKEKFGIEITKVREIILVGGITGVPEAPHYVKGLINLRSMVIPIVDLRLRFGLPEAERTDAARIIVVHVGRKMIGVVVDAVDEVLRVTGDQIAPPPASVAGLNRHYLMGLAKLESRILILLDLDKLLDADEIGV